MGRKGCGFRPEGHGQKSDGDDADALERKRGFDEDDQVNLFQDTHAGANKNRRGLGANRGKDAVRISRARRRRQGARRTTSVTPRRRRPRRRNLLNGKRSRGKFSQRRMDR